jgi:hypothetical protein
MEVWVIWDKSYEELASLLRLDNRCKKQQLHMNESIVKCLSNKEAVTERCQIFTFGFLLAYLLLTPWNRVLEKLTCSQIVKKFPAFYETHYSLSTSEP